MASSNGLSYQPTRREEKIETVGGVSFDDPYQWLEKETAETQAWDDTENRLTLDYLESWSGYAAVRRQLEAVTRAVVEHHARRLPGRTRGLWRSLGAIGDPSQETRPDRSLRRAAG